MLHQILTDLFERDLGKLYVEIESYTDEADLWKVAGNITNPAGNLALHICGNLNHFVGATLGGTGYVRDRDAEFAAKHISRSEILAQIDSTRSMIKSVISDLSDERLAETYPIEVFGSPMTTAWFLTHLTTHLTWHLGQINYHRRWLAL